MTLWFIQFAVNILFLAVALFWLIDRRKLKVILASQEIQTESFAHSPGLQERDLSNEEAV